MDYLTIGLGIIGAGGAYLRGYGVPGAIVGGVVGYGVGATRETWLNYIGLAPPFVADVLSETEINRATLVNGGQPYTDKNGVLWTFDESRQLWTTPYTGRVKGKTETTKPDPSLIDANGREQLAAIAQSQKAFLAYKRQYADVRATDPNNTSGTLNMPNPNDYFVDGRFRKEAYESALSAWKSYNRNVTSRKWADNVGPALKELAANVDDVARAVTEAVKASQTGGAV